MMREKAIQLATNGRKILFIYDSEYNCKTLLHYSLEDYFSKANCINNIRIVNACSFVSDCLFILFSLNFREYIYMLIPSQSLQSFFKSKGEKNNFVANSKKLKI